jgi:hypothetical protein
MCRRAVVVKNPWAISPQLSLLVPHGINKAFQHLHLHLPSGTDSKWMILLMQKKQINVVLISDFETSRLRRPWLL